MEIVNKIKTLESETFLGFSSFKDAIKAALGLYNKKMIFFEALISVIAAIVSFTEKYIYSPKEQIFVLMAFLIVDYITGVAVAIVIKKESFMTRKGQRIIFLMVSYGFAMSGSFWLAKVGEYYFFLPYIVFYYLSFVLLLSSFKNLAMLKLLPPGITNVLNKYVDSHKDKIAEIINENNSEKNC